MKEFDEFMQEVEKEFGPDSDPGELYIKEPERVKAFMKRIFPGIYDLEIDMSFLITIIQQRHDRLNRRKTSGSDKFLSKN